ncbi:MULTISPECIES: helix-turn-helix domain-containing protein [Clostridium]|uniref:helix-turn-helix domain-containing protein n=1 Tax=Clostridium TaxID=1485 RepID=UPI0008244928|nr:MULTISPECIES: helix-turn-helix domain-containing protein [Clostridium]PJI07058.1 helix-turn-helix domain-containing protein [Clostridium sp. CT7]
MNVKDIIHNRRIELGLTYEELGKMVGVGKSTVRKWETGMIENMRRDNIVALAKALNLSPSLIMGWETEEEDSSKKELDMDEAKLLSNYNKLNDLGKNEANKRVAELTCIPIYYDSENAATKILENMSDTIAAHDDDLTPAEKSEMDKRILDKINGFK